MPRRARAKAKNRRRQQAEQISYVKALRRRTSATPATPVVEQPPAGLPTMVEPDVLLAQAIEDLCDSQYAEPLDTWPWTEVELPEGLESPTISTLIPDTGSIESELDEALEDGSQLRSVREVPAELHVEGMMPKAAAAAAADSGLVTILDPDWNEHYASVAVREAVGVELEFTATINPENGMVAQIELESAVSAW